MIEIEGLSKTYGAHTALDGLTLTVARGELFFYLGPNGAGKTTTLRVLAGLLRPTSGRARVAGFDPLREGPALRRAVGYLSDEFVPYEYLTGREYLAFVADMHGLPARDAGVRVERLLDLLDLASAGDRLTREYSHGMRKKLGLAAALIHEPSVLLLDEPTSELDPRSTRLVHEILRGVADQGCCVLVSTHLLGRAATHGDRVGMLAHGRLACCGAPSELLAEHPGRTLEDLFLEVTGQGDRAKLEAFLAARQGGELAGGGGEALP
jgi:ABC-2 type transport system ATP-binding protein